MRTSLFFLLSFFLIGACTASPELPTQALIPRSPTANALIDPPVNNDSPGEPILPGGPGKTPDPIKVEDPIMPLEPINPANPNAPAPGDDKKLRSTTYLDSVQLLILESYPVQINLQLVGSLPTPCHQLRVAIDPPDKENRIYIDVYSLADPDKMCIQVLEPFATAVSLGSFPTGHYQVYINNELIGEFDS